MSKIAALIVAGGRGERAGGGIAKQYRAVLGLPLLAWTARALSANSHIGSVQLVIGKNDRQQYDLALDGLTSLAPATGGQTRQESVLAGLEALGATRPDFVLIHDAARPLVSQDLIDRVFTALEGGAEAVLPILPVVDALKARQGDLWTSASRENLFRAQTPQGFCFKQILKAHREFAGTAAADDIAIAELAGMQITTVAGDERNMKVTTAEDFVLAESLLAANFETRSGFGFDAHRFGPGDHVWLCGVKIPHDFGLVGHSDADAGLHALTDAILGAIAEGDIGQHFKPTDERWRGAASSMFLRHAAKLVAKARGAIIHCDVTLICEAPKLAPYRDAMRASIAQILELDISRVSVKATTTEGMGFTGRGEGIAAQAVATVRMPR